MTTQIKLEYKTKIIKGILIKQDNTYITVKQKNGYNINLLNNEIKILEKKQFFDNKHEIKIKKQQNNNNLTNIMILHTGGTIASKIDYNTGAVSSKFTPEELLNLYPELNKLANLKVKLIGNFFSEDMRFSHYNLLLNQIKNLSNEIDGVIISHGTDTLHYTSTALQYSLNNLNIPIILVGAQRSSDRSSSDAYSNLKTAIQFIIQNKNLDLSFRRVGICMHKNSSDDDFLILDGINAKKMHSTKRNAFKQINYLPYAEISNNNLKILRPELQTKQTNSKLEITNYNENLKIGFFKAHPNLFPEELKQLQIYDAVIIEGTGLGHMAVDEVDDSTKIHIQNLEQLKFLSKKIKLIMGVQTNYGITNMDIYSSGRYIQKYVLGNHMNLTTETLFIRAAFILSKNKFNFEEIWKQNLEGFKLNWGDIDE